MGLLKAGELQVHSAEGREQLGLHVGLSGQIPIQSRSSGVEQLPRCYFMSGSGVLVDAAKHLHEKTARLVRSLRLQARGASLPNRRAEAER